MGDYFYGDGGKGREGGVLIMGVRKGEKSYF